MVMPASRTLATARDATAGDDRARDVRAGSSPAAVLTAWLAEAGRADAALQPRLLRFEDGRILPLPVHRWAGAVTPGDATMLARVAGPVLDVGCGPGRLTAALHLDGDDVLGLDVVAEIPVLARRAGAPLALGSVFGPVPREGQWRTVLLADGNIGIGGDPVRLLRRVATLLTADGTALVELQPPGDLPVRGQARLEALGSTSDWFPWALVGPAGLPAIAAEAGLRVDEVWTSERRDFAALRPV
jgi:SAM-dependent methyltransferase